uniref:Uncharacterized protein n=1 Tax=viral metagenome TaxID=1070528 RepID=A0A6H1Z7Z4_9ZZZZ
MDRTTTNFNRYDYSELRKLFTIKELCSITGLGYYVIKKMVDGAQVNLSNEKIAETILEKLFTK